jgi:hypothetical protein
MKLFRTIIASLILLTLFSESVMASDLSILSCSGPATIAAGASISYTAKVMNSGAETTNASLAIRLDPKVTYSSVSAPSGWSCTGPTVGQSGTVTCTNSTYRTTKYWVASEAVALNEMRYPSGTNGHLYKVTTAGTTGASEPSWPTGSGSTVSDGSVVWTEVGTDTFTVSPTVSSPPDPAVENDRAVASTRVTS